MGLIGASCSPNIVGGHSQVPSKPPTGDNDRYRNLTKEKLKMKALRSCYKLPKARRTRVSYFKRPLLCKNSTA